MFTPEFRNRLDAVIQFAPLDPVTIERVVDKLIVEVEAQLEQKGVHASRSTTRRARWIAEKGYDPKMGARPMARAHPGAHQAAAGRGAAVRQARRAAATCACRWRRTATKLELERCDSRRTARQPERALARDER